MSSAFWISLDASILANLVTAPMAYHWLKYWRGRRGLAWLWGGERNAVVTFSIITNVDDTRFSSKRVLVHIGDAQGVALAQRVLGSTRQRPVEIKPIEEFQPNTDYVNIGGPVCNKATNRLFESLRTGWLLPFGFVPHDHGWALKWLDHSYVLSLSDRDVVQDFGIIAKLPHPEPTGASDRRAFTTVLAGLSTYGTLGATYFAADLNGVRSIRKHLRAFPSYERRYFCALVQVRPRVDLCGIEPHSLLLLDVRPVTRRVI